MTTNIKAVPSTPQTFRLTRKRLLAIALILVGIALIMFANDRFDSTVTTTLTLEEGSIGNAAAIIVSTQWFLFAASVYMIIFGALGFYDPPNLKLATGAFMAIGGFLIFVSVLVAAAAGGRTNIITIFTETLRLATPIAIGAMAGIWCERSGVVNIAIEGMMLIGAAFGFTALFYMQNIWGLFPTEQINIALTIAVAVAVFAGGIVALLHAWLSITFATDQIVSGTVINIFALGITSFIRREVLLSTDAGLTRLPDIEIPILSDIPIIGQAFFVGKPIFFLMFVVIIATHVIMFHTKWGLRTRAVGENPHAADTLGIKVNRMRWINVFIAGMIAGLAGAWFSLEATGRFTDGMTNGKGFISLAAMIFGKWTPFGAFGGALLFGFSETLGFRFQIVGVPIPPQFLQMVPYVVTIIVLAGLVGRAEPPKAVGKPYKKE
jgi:ABC-type uncharacterized transport system permease subunit